MPLIGIPRVGLPALWEEANQTAPGARRIRFLNIPSLFGDSFFFWSFGVFLTLFRGALQGRAIQLPMMRVPSMEAGELNLSMRSNGGPSGAVQVESDSKQPNRVRK